MKTWRQLLVRHGWNLKHVGENTFNHQGELEENINFLRESLDKLGVTYSYNKETIEIIDNPVLESKWINVLDFDYRGQSEIIGLSKFSHGPPVAKLDTYISGIVRQLNRLGFYTISSCDGHNRRGAHVTVTKDIEVDHLVNLLLSVGMHRVYYREMGRYYKINLSFGHATLLDLAEKMSKVDIDLVNEDLDVIQEHLFYSNLDELLNIPGVSGNEATIRDVVKGKIAPFVDNLSVDRSGNLLAERKYRAGNGPTILLNAHLDIYEELKPGRIIMKEDGIWHSSDGILGADDRAGVAVLLHMAEMLNNSSFSGRIKFIFTVGEERGLIGAKRIDEYFLWGTDAAFVIDRRGSGDIVTSCFNTPFCHDRFGSLIEEIATEAGIENWKCTSGGSSDTRIWAEHGIQSVNLSAGYGNEHTKDEYLDVKACYNVTKLLSAIFEQSRKVGTVVGSIENKRRIFKGIIGRKSV